MARVGDCMVLVICFLLLTSNTSDAASDCEVICHRQDINYTEWAICSLRYCLFQTSALRAPRGHGAALLAGAPEASRRLLRD